MRSYHLLARNAARETMLALHEIFPAAQRYVDVGAGTGAFAAEAKRQGRIVLACERSRVGRLFARSQGVDCHPFNLNRTSPADLDGPFDLAYCFELAEHLDRWLGDRLVVFLSNLAPIVVFSAAQPGQGGLGHVNEQPTDYWIDLFEKEGQIYRPDLTTQLKARLYPLTMSAPWLPANLTVFQS
jgi:SAM-dependent methyltransferase